MSGQILPVIEEAFVFRRRVACCGHPNLNSGYVCAPTAPMSNIACPAAREKRSAVAVYPSSHSLLALAKFQSF